MNFDPEPLSVVTDQGGGESKFYRALPRRRKDSNNKQIQTFIRKTFEMINECNYEIASWTDDGQRFVVKQPDKFAQEMIPRFFKHNKLSSFVRQLNFYGFRKVQSSARNKVDEDETREWWEFHHPQFQRGREDLLCDIKRSSHYEETKGGVDGMSPTEHVGSAIMELRNEVDQLKYLVQNLQNEVKWLNQQSLNPQQPKKRKLYQVAEPSMLQGYQRGEPKVFGSEDDHSTYYLFQEMQVPQKRGMRQQRGRMAGPHPMGNLYGDVRKQPQQHLPPHMTGNAKRPTNADQEVLETLMSMKSTNNSTPEGVHYA